MNRSSIKVRQWVPKSNCAIAAILFALALVLRLFLFWYPKQFVFDEVYFIDFISNYVAGVFYFDVHPPLGKLLLYGFGKLVWFDGLPAAHTIGEHFPNDSYFYLRLLPIVCGALLPAVVFLFARTLKLSRSAAVLAGLAIVFENSLVVHSRFVFLDMFLLLFGFLGLYLYFKSREKIGGGATLYRIFAFIFLSLSFCIKWTGLTYLAIAFVAELYSLVNDRTRRSGWKNARAGALKIAFYFICVPLVVYAVPFFVHFELLPLSGPGAAFMSPRFQTTLSKGPAGTVAAFGGAADGQTGTMPFVAKFVELNKTMFTASANLAAPHSYSSKWYTWPLDIRGIFYWSGPDNRMIYLIGNPFIYWLSTAAVCLCLIGSIRARSKDKTGNLILFGYFLNLLPFMFIGRVMFLYHYFTALIFSILCLGYMLDKVPDLKKKTRYVSCLLLLFICSFLYFSPLTYGIKNAHIFQRFWLPSWR